MDKNVVWAVVLSTIILVASFILQPILFGASEVEEPTAIEYVEEDTNTSANTQETVELGNEIIAENAEEDVLVEESLKEEKITISTNKADVVFTTLGGDIVSYKLKDHLDTDTNEGIQISDNINDFNRTCAISLGGADSMIIDKIFSYEKIDDLTHLFKTNFKVKDSNGTVKSFVLGKKYSFKEDENMFKLDVLIHGLDNMRGLNFDGVAYSLRTSPQIGPHFDPKENKYENRQFLAHNGSKTKKIILTSGEFKRYDKSFVWVGIAGKYFEELLIPADTTTMNASYYSSKIEANNYANAQAIVERRAFAESDVQDTYYFYFGPRNEKDLKVYNVAENNAWGFGGKRLTDSLQSSGWLSWLEVILKWCLEMIHKVVKNWGVAIIIMTILLKVLLFPLSKKQSLGTLKMQQLQPKMQELQEKYKDNQQKLQAETAKLYQESGYNPASGCLPMIFQFLLLFAMYNLFNNYFEFRGASFIKGWIPDLSAGDSIYTFKFNIPFLGNHLRLLPIIYVISQLLFGKITNNGGMANSQSAGMMKFMTYGMPIMFFFLFYNAPSGLLLYWTVSNIFQMGQQIIINKLMAQKKAEMAGNVKKQKTLPPKAKRK